MSVISKEVSVSKEFSELGEGLVALITALKPAISDGFQVSDMGVIISSIVALVPALKGVELLDDEAIADPEAFALAGALASAGIVKALRK